jgi:hypothetical protein
MPRDATRRGDECVVVVAVASAGSSTVSEVAGPPCLALVLDVAGAPGLALVIDVAGSPGLALVLDVAGSPAFTPRCLLLQSIATFALAFMMR